MARSTPTFYALKRYSLSILLPFLMASSVWVYFQRVMIPYQQNQALREDKPRGNLSDLYPRWLGTRELLLHGRDPYSPEITGEIQGGYYGRPLDANRPNDPRDQQAFAYPLYVVWILAPTVGMPFWLAQRTILLVLVGMTALSVFLWLEMLDWRLPFDWKVAWILLTVSCLPAVQGIKLQQLTLLVAGLIAVYERALTRGWLMLAGALLASATIKPQLVFLLLLWLGIWVAGDWRARRRLLWSFAITMAVLVGASEAMLPGWIREFRAALASYYRYTGGGLSLLDIIFTPVLGRMVSVFLVAILIVLLWKLRSSAASSPAFTYAFSLTIATTLLVIPMFAPYNQILLLPAVMMLVRATASKPPKGYLSRFLVLAMKLSVVWPFMSAALLVLALPFFHSFVVAKAAGLPFYSTLAVPVSVYATLLMFTNQLVSEPRTPQPLTLRRGASSG